MTKIMTKIVVPRITAVTGTQTDAVAVCRAVPCRLVHSAAALKR